MEVTIMQEEKELIFSDFHQALETYFEEIKNYPVFGHLIQTKDGYTVLVNKKLPRNTNGKDANLTAGTTLISTFRIENVGLEMIKRSIPQ